MNDSYYADISKHQVFSKKYNELFIKYSTSNKLTNQCYLNLFNDQIKYVKSITKRDNKSTIDNANDLIEKIEQTGRDEIEVDTCRNCNILLNEKSELQRKVEDLENSQERSDEIITDNKNLIGDISNLKLQLENSNKKFNSINLEYLDNLQFINNIVIDLLDKNNINRPRLPTDNMFEVKIRRQYTELLLFTLYNGLNKLN